MLSMPPASTALALPATSMSWPNIIARMPEPHILLSVTAPAESGRPALRIAWRAGAWPWPAIRQLPISTSSIESPGTPARSIAALIATAPSSQACSDEKSPSMPPIGVRAAEAMTMDSAMRYSCFDRSVGGQQRRAALFVRHTLDVGLEARILAAQQQRQRVVKVVAAAPLAHVVVPAVPAPLL